MLSSLSMNPCLWDRAMSLLPHLGHCWFRCITSLLGTAWLSHPIRAISGQLTALRCDAVEPLPVGRLKASLLYPQPRQNTDNENPLAEEPYSYYKSCLTLSRNVSLA